jgi:hypothetical protein
LNIDLRWRNEKKCLARESCCISMKQGDGRHCSSLQAFHPHKPLVAYFRAAMNVSISSHGRAGHHILWIFPAGRIVSSRLINEFSNPKSPIYVNCTGKSFCSNPLLGGWHIHMFSPSVQFGREMCICSLLPRLNQKGNYATLCLNFNTFEIQFLTVYTAIQCGTEFSFLLDQSIMHESSPMMPTSQKRPHSEYC